MPDLTPNQGPSDSDLKGVFFNLYENGNGPEADAVDPDPTPDPAPVDPQPTDADDTSESDATADNDGDDDEYEIVEVDEDDVLDDDELIDEDLEGSDDDSGEEGSEDSKDGEEDAEDDTDVSAYLYHDEDEGRDIFLKAVDPATGESSIYLDREEAERGLANQVAFIGELKKQVAETREASDARIAELEKQVVLYESGTNPEAAKEILIQGEMPERFRGVDAATLSDEDLRAYKNARLDAEIKVEREVRTKAEQAQDARKAADAAQDRADQHIRSRMTDLKFFGKKNVEDQRTIRQKMAEKPEGSDFDYSEIVTSVAKAFGNQVADQMLLSIVGGQQEALTDSEPTEPKAKAKAKKAAKPKAEQVQKVKKKVRRKKAKPTNSTPATPEVSKMGAKNILKDAFKTQGKPKKSI